MAQNLYGDLFPVLESEVAMDEKRPWLMSRDGAEAQGTLRLPIPTRTSYWLSGVANLEERDQVVSIERENHTAQSKKE